MARSTGSVFLLGNSLGMAVYSVLFGKDRLGMQESRFAGDFVKGDSMKIICIFRASCILLCSEPLQSSVVIRDG